RLLCEISTPIGRIEILGPHVMRNVGVPPSEWQSALDLVQTDCQQADRSKHQQDRGLFHSLDDDSSHGSARPFRNAACPTHTPWLAMLIVANDIVRGSPVRAAAFLGFGLYFPTSQGEPDRDATVSEFSGNRRRVTFRVSRISFHGPVAGSIPRWWMARQMRSDVAGIGKSSTPSGASASIIALMIAAGAATLPASAPPLTPSRFVLVGTGCTSDPIGGMLSARGMA